jgi:hypothetical protein
VLSSCHSCLAQSALVQGNLVAALFLCFVFVVFVLWLHGHPQGARGSQNTYVLSATDILALATMKNAAKCDT